MVYLTLTQAAEFLNVSRGLVFRHVQQNRYAGVKYCECGNSLLIPKKSLARPSKPARRRRAKKSAALVRCGK